MPAISAYSEWLSKYLSVAIFASRMVTTDFAIVQIWFHFRNPTYNPFFLFTIPPILTNAVELFPTAFHRCASDC